MKQFTQAYYLRARKREDMFTLICLVVSGCLTVAMTYFNLL